MSRKAIPAVGRADGAGIKSLLPIDLGLVFIRENRYVILYAMCKTTTPDTLQNDNPDMFSFIIPNLDLVRIFANVGIYRFFNLISLPARDFEYQIIERRSTKDINMITCHRSV